MRQPPLPKHRKVRGELAETIFLSAALRRGFRVSKPYGDNSPYDFIVERAGRISRVQVKATAHYDKLHRTGYRFHTSRNLGPRCRRTRVYLARDIDFIAGYVFPLDAWFIIPVATVHATMVRVLGRRRRSRYDRYREAWHLLC